MPFGGLIEHLFLSLTSISLYAHNTICLSKHLFKDILFCFHVLTIINICIYINICIGFCVDRSFQVNCVNTWAWLLDCMLRKSEKVKVKSLSQVQFFATTWTVAYQDPPSMGFSRQEYWSGLPLPSPGDLPNPGIKPGSPAF